VELSEDMTVPGELCGRLVSGYCGEYGIDIEFGDVKGEGTPMLLMFGD